MARPAPGWRRGGSVIVGGYAGIGDRRPSGCAPPFRPGDGRRPEPGASR